MKKILDLIERKVSLSEKGTRCRCVNCDTWKIFKKSDIDCSKIKCPECGKYMYTVIREGEK